MLQTFLLLSLLIPSFCNLTSGNSQVVAKVGDSITVSGWDEEVTSYAAISGGRTWDILHIGRHNFEPCLEKSPLICEYDVRYPRIALIMIGTNDPYEWSETWFTQNNIREIVKQTLNRGILPVLYTIPYNINKDVSPINQFVRALVVELELPLIEYFAEMAVLPNSGISIDGVHPSEEGYDLRNQLTFDKLNEIYAMCGW